MSLFKESRDFLRFFFKTPLEHKKIIFYAEHNGYYPYFQGTIEELSRKHKTPLCYITSSNQDEILTTKNLLIKTFYLKKLLPLFMILVNTKAFVMTLTDLHQFHLKRSTNPVHYIYMFHALVSTHMMYREGAFDYYDTILCCGPHQTTEIRQREEQEHVTKKNLIAGGYYRLEQIHGEYLQKKHISTNEKTILIAPSWGDHNIIKTCGHNLISNILENTDYHIILRPHPETIKHMSTELAKYKKLFGQNKRFNLETSTSTNDSILQADLLITDLSGIALEYAFGTERPVLFIDLPYKIKNPNYNKLNLEPFELSIRSKIGTILSPEEIAMAPQKISDLIQNKEQFREKIIQLRNKNIYAFGNSSSIAAKTILNLLI